MIRNSTVKPTSATLLINCPDRRGLVASIANFVCQHGGNILHADQHQDRELGLFFMRVEWDLEAFDIERKNFERCFGPLAESLRMTWRISYSDQEQRVAVFVSQHLHCLVDLLHRVHTKELNCKVVAIISNHLDAEPLAHFYNVPYAFVPVDDVNKLEAEAKHLELLAGYDASLVVLARYMRILSPEFVSRFPSKIINVHHSFLPAFVGSKPYHAAHARGVKLIGATSHYVTDELDQGPIIEQDVTRISHRDSTQELITKGRDLERVVLARAVRWHLEDRLLCYGNKTVVFD
jgi:formyltetrahydrofolate deformylase